ncbi:MAG: class I SAM-dependent methyltransferase [Deltaproteobacteria bacterium]|nr:class I SAM-dependent methyltransferase [Deltaproteobacteria bacterium]
MLKSNLIKKLTTVPSQTYDKTFLKDFLYGSTFELDQRIRTHTRMGSRSDFHQWIVSKIKPEGMLTLDAGCGTGNLLIPIANHIKKHQKQGYVVGVDISQSLINHLNKYLIQTKLPVTCATADIEKLNFPDKMFDRVLCAYVLYHCPKIHKALSELHRVVKENGRVFVMTNSRETMREFERINSEVLSLTLSAKVPLAARIESRFCSENANDYFSKYFRIINRFTYRDVLEFSTAKDFINFYNSSRGRNRFYLTRHQCELLQKKLRYVTENLMSGSGVIQIKKCSHLFCLTSL